MHPNVDQLKAFGHGNASEAETIDIAAHLDTCNECKTVVDTLPDDSLITLIRDVVRRPSEQAEATIDDCWLPDELLAHPRYQLIRWIGAGGMGVVYEARHRLMERSVAIKVISKHLTANGQITERFQKEVKAAARLSHPNIVAAYDAEQAGSIHFFVMEFIEGKSLARNVEEDGPLPVALACQYICQTALGLQHAFEKGLVHRDIKPQNLMVTPQGTVKILDFGLASLISDASAGGSITEFGQVLGTPDYIPPEQVRDSRSADTRSDIYSLGCTLYYLLTGQPPFPWGSTTEKLAAHMDRKPRHLSELRDGVPIELVSVVERMMAPSPDERYRHPVEVAEALQPFSGPSSFARRTSKLSRYLVVGGLAGLLILGAIIVGFPGCGDEKGPQVASPNKTKKEKEIQALRQFSEVEIQKPFDEYLLANPLLMQTAGAKVIYRKNGDRIVIGVASTVLKDESPNELLRAQRICQIKAIANIVAAKEGVQVYRTEELKERTTVTLENDKETGQSISDLLQITRTKVEGIAKGMPVVGRWKSKDGNVYYLAIGSILDGKGQPLPQGQ